MCVVKNRMTGQCTANIWCEKTPKDVDCTDSQDSETLSFFLRKAETEGRRA